MVSLIPGHTGKADLQHEIKKVCGVVPAESIQADLKTHVIDAINVVNTIVPKPSWIETGDDLA